MTRDGTTGGGAAGAATVLAALVVGALAMIGFVLVEVDSARALVAVAVLAAGTGVYVGLRGPLGESVARGVGSGLVVFGAQLLGASLLVGVAGADGLLTVLCGYGVPALAMLGFAVLGMRAWATGAGVVLSSVVVLVLRDLGSPGLPELTMLVVAVLLTALVVVTPAGTRWGGFVGAAAATCALHASGAGLLLFVLVGWVPLPDLGPFWVLSDGLRLACSVGSVVVACVLLTLSAVRREVVTGLVAAAVVTFGAAGPGLPYVWLPLAALALALVALRVPAVRMAVARIPVVLRGRGDAVTAAGCAVVAGGALVVFAWHGLPALDASRTLTGVSTLVVLLIAGALAHFLPSRGGAALAVVTLVVLLLSRPWVLLFGDGGWRVGGTVGLVAFAVALVASWVLTQRHDTPAVWGAATYLMLGALPDVLAPLLGLDRAGDTDPTGHVVTLVLPLALIGVPAAVLTWWRPAVARWQAVAAVVVGSAVAVPAYVTLSAATPQGGSLGSPVNPLVPTDTLASTAFLDEHGVAAVFVAITLLALAVVVSVGRRPVAPVAVTATLVVYATLPPALARMDAANADVGLFTLALAVAALALVAAAWFAARRHVSGPEPVNWA